MAQSTVTRAFEAWNVGKVLDGLPAVADKVVFALVPGQDESKAVSRDEGMPTTANIKYTAEITQAGVLNDNAVVYSVVLDTSIGDWDYNWIGLIDSKTNTVLMIVHVRTQQKLKTSNGQQGNSLTRNLSMQFDGAAAATQINVSAQTWQIDFSARLFSMDEALRMAMLDYYGSAAFIDSGFNVTLSGKQATIAPGAGYVGGLRAQLDEAVNVTVTANTAVWLDVSRQGTATGAWANHVTFKAANTLENYTDAAGYHHYVAKLATISNSLLTDARPVSPIVALDERFLPIKGTAVAASKLATSRTIAGVSFDGTKNITLSAEDVGIVKQASPYDATAGSLLPVGAFGLGAATQTALSAIDIDTYDFKTGFYSGVNWTASIKGLPTGFSGAAWAYLLNQNLASEGANFKYQELAVNTSANPCRWWRRKVNGKWGEWRQYWDTTLLANPVTTDTEQTINGTKIFRALQVKSETGNTGIEIGRIDASSYSILDFHTSGANTDYDSRIITSGGSVSATGQGTMNIIAGSLQWGAAPVLASGRNAISDARGYWKTPDSAELTPASMGALSITELAGIPLPFPGAVAPVGWLKCNGQAFDKILYPVLATLYPTGNLPDLRGEFIRGWDDGRGIDNDRTILSSQSDELKSHSHENVPKYLSPSTDNDRGANPSLFSVDSTGSTAMTGGDETRPRNIAFNYIVRAA